MPKPHCMFIQAQDVPWEKGIVRLTGPDLKNLQSRTFRLQVDTTRPAQRLGLV